MRATENKVLALRRRAEKLFSTRRRISAAGGLALVHSDGAARKAGGVKISHLANALADQNSRKPDFAWLAAFDQILHGRD